MEQKKNMSRREALKRMGASTLALAVGTSGVASLLESCADKPKAVEPVAEATDEVKDLARQGSGGRLGHLLTFRSDHWPWEG